MRETKFRAWDKVTKQMLDITFIDFEDGEVGLINFEDNRRSLDQVELLEFTGLKDKDGKEIYEGDIVRRGGRGRGAKVLYEVVFDNGGFRIKGGLSSIKAMIYASKVNHKGGLEVIGNVYENAQLLRI